MKKTLTTLLIAAAVATPLAIFASPDGDRPCANKGAAQLTETLGLNTDQQAKIDALFAEQAKQREADRAARQAQREANRKAMEDKLSQVLTKEQFEKFQAMQAERAQWREERREAREQWRGEHGYRPAERHDD